MNAKRKAAWMLEFERITVAAGTYQPGKVDWDAAVYFYSLHKTPEQAAETATYQNTPLKGVQS